MKKWLYTAGMGVFLIACTINVANADEKVAIVDVNQVFVKTPLREDAAKRLQNEFKNRETELQKTEKDLQTKIQNFQRDAKTMKEAERTNLEKSIISERDSFAAKAQTFEQDHRKREMEERDKIFQKIQGTIKSVAEKKGYTLVIDSNAVLYSKSVPNLTDDVIKQVK